MERETYTEKQKDREIQRWKDRYRESETDRCRNKETEKKEEEGQKCRKILLQQRRKVY